MKTFGQILKEKRRAKGWTQAVLGNMLNVGFLTVSNWERDMSVPNVYMAADIAQIFGCTLDDFLRG